MRNKNWLADVFDYLGEIFERLSPALFRMLSTVLPYITPLPVAWLTAHSASEFLGFGNTISVIFVIMLEGIGLWATTELVDAFVEAVRSKNAKSWGVVIFLSMVVTVYIVLLVSLNVTLERATGNTSSTYSLVLTLICFLPLISGCLNGYRKVKMETKTNMQVAKEKQDDLNDRIRHEQNDLKLKKAAIKAGYNPFTPVPTVTLNQDIPVVNEQERRASDYKHKIWQYMDEQYSKGKILRVVDITEHFKLPYNKAKGFVSTQRTLWAQDRGVDLRTSGSTS